mgnify:FL=1
MASILFKPASSPFMTTCPVLPTLSTYDLTGSTVLNPSPWSIFYIFDEFLGWICVLSSYWDLWRVSHIKGMLYPFYIVIERMY